MKSFTILSLAVLLCCSCQKDNTQQEGVDSKTENLSKKTQPLDLKLKIGNAYNVQKFKSESFLKYSVDVKFSDTTYFKGVLNYNISENSVNVKISEGEFDSENNAEDSDLIDFVSNLNEIYTLPFVLTNENLITLDANDSLVKSKFISSSSAVSYELTTHPLTEIIQSVKIEKPKGIFDNSTITFDKYITVNRIPVSMLWEVYKGDKPVGEVKISRISYPKG